MRDLIDYQKRYIDLGFERYKVYYRRKKVMEVVDAYHPQSILEIGCGMDPLFQYVPFREYTFVEPGELFFRNAITLAKGKETINGINKPFGKRELDPEQTFDLIVCTSLLHEIEKPEQMLGDIWEVAAEDTIIHISVPNGNSFHRLLAKAMHLVKDSKDFSENNILFQQNRVFDMDTLIKLVEQSGFRVIESGDYFIKPFTHDQMMKIIEQGIINEEILDGLYELSKLIPGIGSELYLNCKRK